jgi:cell division septum initiation protein DivIVA
MVQCHKIMKSFEQAKFKDAPCISNAYVKFIMTNSSSDSLTAKVTALQQQLKELTKISKSASTSAISASNAATEAKQLITELKK